MKTKSEAFTRADPKMQSLRRALTRHFSTFHHAPPPPSKYSPRSTEYDSLITTAAETRDFTTLQHLLNSRAKDKCFNTNNTFKFISTNLSILDDLLNIFSTLDKGMSQKGAYNSLIAQLSKLNETRRALRVAEEMVKNEAGAKTSSFHPILNSASRSGEVWAVLRVLEIMENYEIVPNTTSYNYLLSFYCFRGDMVRAGELVEKMRGLGLEEDDKTYDLLVMGAVKAGKLDSALMLMRRMVEEGVVPLFSTYAHVINGMCNEGCFVQAVEFVKSYGGRDVRFDVENFGLLGARLIKLEKFDEAIMVVKEMEKRGIPMAERLKDFYQSRVSS